MARQRQQRSLAFRLMVMVIAAMTITLWSNPQILGMADASPAEAATLAPGTALAVEPMPFEKPGESFPGSAYYYVVPDTIPANYFNPIQGDLASTAHGDDANGPTAFGALASGEPGPAARALRQVANPIDRTRALTCLTAAIYYEAASEPDDGQRAVAQVVLNRVAHPAFPKTVCGVVYQGSERTTGCQFTFSCDGSLARARAPFFWRRAEMVARAALAGFVFTPVGLATHYHTFAVHPAWDSALDFIGQIGAHRFYRMAGAAGAAPAFHFAYAGGEPLPQPHPRSTAPALRDTSPDPLAIERAYDAGLRAAQGDPRQVGLLAAKTAASPEPAFSSEATQRGGDAAFRLPERSGESDVKPEYVASGRWISEPQ